MITIENKVDKYIVRVSEFKSLSKVQYGVDTMGYSIEYIC